MCQGLKGAKEFANGC